MAFHMDYDELAAYCQRTGQTNPLALDDTPKRSKYGNHETECDGFIFDSKREADRWVELTHMARAGLITKLERQVKYVLVPKQEGEQAVTYVADFVYEQDGQTVVEDVKSEATRKDKVYIIKRKLMRYMRGIKIQEIR